LTDSDAINALSHVAAAAAPSSFQELEAAAMLDADSEL